MIEFLPVKTLEPAENIEFLPFILSLLFKNRRFLTDDYFPSGDWELMEFFLKEMNAIYPWFFVGTLNNQPIGAAWITHWHYPHSCQLHGCVDKKFYGKTALFALKELVSFLAVNTGIKRIQMEIPEFNKLAVNFAKKAGFKEEGIIKCATLKNAKPLNHVLLGMILN